MPIFLVFGLHAWYLSGLGDDYCMYYDDGPASRWSQSWVESRINTYEVKSVRLGFIFDDAPGAGDPGIGSIYNQTKIDEVLDILDGYGVTGILLLQNNGVSCEDYVGSWDWYYNWLNVTTDFLADDRISAFSIFGEPAHDDYYDTWADDGPVGAITNRLELQEAFAYLIEDIHEIDSDRIVIYPLGSFQYTSVSSWVNDISLVGMLSEPNVIFDVVHPYYFENSWDMGLTPTQKAAWYESVWVEPSINYFGAEKCWCGETFAWGGKTYAYQVEFLTAMINVFVNYEMGFQVWAYFSSPNQSWQNDALYASDYLGMEPPEEEPEEPEPPIYTVIVSAGTGGTTSPTSGTYNYSTSTQFSITAYPSTNYLFDYWNRNGSQYSVNNPLAFYGAENATYAVQPVFLYVPPEEPETPEPEPEEPETPSLPSYPLEPYPSNEIIVEGSGFQIFVNQTGGFAFQHSHIETNKTITIEVLAGTWNGTDARLGMSARGGTLSFYSNALAYIQLENLYELGIKLQTEGIQLSRLSDNSFNGTIPAGVECYLHWSWGWLLPHEENFLLWVGLLGVVLLLFGLMLAVYCFRHYPIFTLSDTELVWEKTALMAALCSIIIGFGLIVTWLLG